MYFAKSKWYGTHLKHDQSLHADFPEGFLTMIFNVLVMFPLTDGTQLGIPARIPLDFVLFLVQGSTVNLVTRHAVNFT